MRYYLLLPALAFLMVACGNDAANRTQPIESKAVESMSPREAQLLGLDYQVTEQGTQPVVWAGPRTYSMPEAQRLASETGKKVLIDVYTVWCGFCRKMAAETYPSQLVKNVVDDHFYVVRLNAESDKKIIFNGEEFTEAELAGAFGVSSFPTTIFINTNGEPLGLQPGFMDASMFSSLIGFVGSDAFRSESYEDYLRRTGN